MRSRQNQTAVVSRRGPMFVEETTQEEPRKGGCLTTILAGMATVGTTALTSPIGEKIAEAAYKCTEVPGALAMCNYEEMDMLYSVIGPVGLGLAVGAIVYSAFSK